MKSVHRLFRPSVKKGNITRTYVEIAYFGHCAVPLDLSYQYIYKDINLVKGEKT